MFNIYSMYLQDILDFAITDTLLFIERNLNFTFRFISILIAIFERMMIMKTRLCNKTNKLYKDLIITIFIIIIIYRHLNVLYV